MPSLLTRNTQRAEHVRSDDQRRDAHDAASSTTTMASESSMPEWMRVLVDEMRAVRVAIERRERDEAERREREEHALILRRLTDALDTMTSRGSPTIPNEHPPRFNSSASASATEARSDSRTPSTKKRRKEYEEEDASIVPKRKYTRKPSNTSNAPQKYPADFDAAHLYKSVLGQSTAVDRHERDDHSAILRRLTEALDTVVPRGMSALQNGPLPANLGSTAIQNNGAKSKSDSTSTHDISLTSSDQRKKSKKSEDDEAEDEQNNRSARKSGSTQSLTDNDEASSSKVKSKAAKKLSSSSVQKGNEGSMDAPKSKNTRRSSSGAEPRRYARAFEEARLCDLVLDQNGVWRTKRSILENPSGRRIGRPAGVKTGEGAGRSREMNRGRNIKVERNAAVAQTLNAAEGAVIQKATRSLPAKRNKQALKADDNSSSDQADLSALDDDVIASALQAILSSSSPIREPPGKAPSSPPRPLPRKAPSSPGLPPPRKAPSSPSQPFSKKAPSNAKRPSSTMAQRYAHTARSKKAKAAVLPTASHHGTIQSTPKGLPALANQSPLGMGQARYGAPVHLLTSSPATAFKTVMDEADSDWKALFGFTHSPVRRSPRKRPPGVHDQLNPYATDGSIRHVGTQHENDKAVGVDSSVLMHMTSSSPLTRSRVKSGQFDWAWGASSDNTDGQTKATSVVTSPTSPSPNRSRRTGKSIAGPELVLEAGPLIGAGSSYSCQGAGKSSKQSSAKQQHDESTDLNSGPFMGSSSLDDVEQLNGSQPRKPGRSLEEEDYEGPGSPTLGRSRRMDRKKQESRASAASSMLTSHTTPTSDGISSAAALQDAPSTTNEWGRNTTIQDLFPPPLSPEKRWNAGSPSQVLWNSPTSWALRMPTPSPVKSGGQEDKNATNPAVHALQSDAKLVASPAEVTSQKSPFGSASSNKPSPHLAAVPGNRRKPLPATVEDATPSDINTSPTGEEVYDEEEEEEEAEVGADGEVVIDMNDGASLSALMSMFDDPYGLLAAMQQQHQQQSNATAGEPAVLDVLQSRLPLQSQHCNGQTASPASVTRPTDSLSHVELFKSFDFAQQLNCFSETGGSGIAANAGPSGPFAATTIGKPATTTAPAIHAPPPAFTVRVSPRKAAQRQTANTGKDGQRANSHDVDFGDWVWSEATKNGVGCSQPASAAEATLKATTNTTTQ